MERHYNYYLIQRDINLCKTSKSSFLPFSNNVLFYTPYHNNRTQVLDAAGTLDVRPMWIKVKFDPYLSSTFYTTNWFKGIEYYTPPQRQKSESELQVNYRIKKNFETFFIKHFLKQNLSLFGMWQELDSDRKHCITTNTTTFLKWSGWMCSIYIYIYLTTKHCQVSREALLYHLLSSIDDD